LQFMTDCHIILQDKQIKRKGKPVKTEKAIAKGVSIRPSQLEKVGTIIDLTKHGQFSQFVCEAITEKLEKLNPQAQQEKLAS
jgi:hypothetical protein